MKACWKFSRVPFQVAPMVSARLACRTTPKHSTSKRRLLQSGLWSFGHSEISSGTSGSKRACELPISSPLSHGARNAKYWDIQYTNPMSWSELMVFCRAIHCTIPATHPHFFSSCQRRHLQANLLCFTAPRPTQSAMIRNSKPETLNLNTLRPGMTLNNISLQPGVGKTSRDAKLIHPKLWCFWSHSTLHEFIDKGRLFVGFRALQSSMCTGKESFTHHTSDMNTCMEDGALWPQKRSKQTPKIKRFQTVTACRHSHTSAPWC